MSSYLAQGNKSLSLSPSLSYVLSGIQPKTRNLSSVMYMCFCVCVRGVFNVFIYVAKLQLPWVVRLQLRLDKNCTAHIKCNIIFLWVTQTKRKVNEGKQERGGEKWGRGRGETWGVITMNVICLSCRPFILAAEVEQELPQCRGSKSQPNGRRLQFKGRGGARSKQEGPRSKKGGNWAAASQGAANWFFYFFLPCFFSVAHCCSKNIDGHVVSCQTKQRERKSRRKGCSSRETGGTAR